MTRSLCALVLCLAASCHEHPASQVEVTGEDCVACHESDYQRAEPPHPGVFPRTCASCHRTASWTPALAGPHPDRAFPLRPGTHGGIDCFDCHDPDRGPSTDGANTDCVGCHTGEHARGAMADVHRGIAEYVFDAARPNFCLSCHPAGEAAGHPDDRFPISSGAHEGFACADCHDRAAGPDQGGDNTDCIGCHTGAHSRARMDDTHHEEGGYRWQPDVPNFCLDCHPRGRAEDD